MKKVNIQLMAIVLVIGVLLGFSAFGLLLKDIPLWFMGQYKVGRFEIENEDIFADIGDPDISYSCGVAAYDFFKIDPLSNIGFVCEGHKYATGGGVCVCVAGLTEQSKYGIHYQ